MVRFHDPDYIRYLEFVSEKSKQSNSDCEITEEEKKKILADPSKT